MTYFNQKNLGYKGVFVYILGKKNEIRGETAKMLLKVK